MTFVFVFVFLFFYSVAITSAATLFNPSSRPRIALTILAIPLAAVSGGEKGISELLLSSNITSAAEVEKVLRDKEGFVRYKHLHRMAGVLQTDFMGWTLWTDLNALRKREILAKLADFAQQLLFREAQRLWSDPN